MGWVFRLIRKGSVKWKTSTWIWIKEIVEEEESSLVDVVQESKEEEVLTWDI